MNLTWPFWGNFGPFDLFWSNFAFFFQWFLPLLRCFGTFWSRPFCNFFNRFFWAPFGPQSDFWQRQNIDKGCFLLQVSVGFHGWWMSIHVSSQAMTTRPNLPPRAMPAFYRVSLWLLFCLVSVFVSRFSLKTLFISTILKAFSFTFKSEGVSFHSKLKKVTNWKPSVLKTGKKGSIT